MLALNPAINITDGLNVYVLAVIIINPRLVSLFF